MKKIVNQKKYPDINDSSILGSSVYIKSGKSKIVVEEIAEVLIKKYPWLKMEDYTKPKKVVEKTAKKKVPKKKYEKKKSKRR